MLPISRGPSDAHGLEVGDPEPLDPLVAELVAVAEKLVAAAYREHHGPVRHGRREPVALRRDHVGGHQPLVAILAAADVDQVVRRGVDPVARPGGRVLEADPAPLAAPAQEQDVAPVRVDVHLLGVERQQAELRGSSRPLQEDDGRADVQLARGHLAPAGGPQAGAAASPSSRSASSTASRIFVDRLAQLAVGRDDLAETREHHRPHRRATTSSGRLE